MKINSLKVDFIYNLLLFISVLVKTSNLFTFIIDEYCTNMYYYCMFWLFLLELNFLCRGSSIWGVAKKI